MWIPVRWFLSMTLVVSALLGPWNANVQAQINPAAMQAAAFRNTALMQMNLNPYVHPFAAQQMFQAAMVGRVFQANAALTNAGLTHPMAALAGAGYGARVGGLAGYGFGLNVGARYGLMAGMNGGGMSPMSQMGYGSLMNGGMGGGGGGYGVGGGMSGVLAASALSGAGYGFGMGLGNTQWMQNPYEGYLKGAADITRSNAQYYQTIQQAKLTRQESRRSALQTRRAVIEEIEWEREHMPDPEKLRQQALERELSHARLSPPLTDIWTARSLNALLRNLVNLQGDGTKGPDVPLDEDIVNHINVTNGDSSGNLGLLKNSADLDWPETLQRGIFKESRENVNKLMETAYRSVIANKLPADATLADLQDSYLKMLNTYESHIKDFTPDEGIEAQRYLNEIKDTIKALKDPNVCTLFNDSKPKSKNVAELVRFMREKGLQFAPATGQDLAAYVALYNKLAAFDASMPRIASTSTNFDNK